MNIELLGNRIQQFREASGLTQEELASRSGISIKHISVLERGLKAPKLETLVNIANALHVSSDMLLQDVVLYAADGLASELSATISKLSPKEQERVLNAIRALTE